MVEQREVVVPVVVADLVLCSEPALRVALDTWLAKKTLRQAQPVNPQTVLCCIRGLFAHGTMMNASGDFLRHFFGPPRNLQS